MRTPCRSPSAKCRSATATGSRSPDRRVDELALFVTEYPARLGSFPILEAAAIIEFVPKATHVDDLLRDNLGRRDETVRKIEQALVTAGIEFIHEDGGGTGTALKKDGSKKSK